MQIEIKNTTKQDIIDTIKTGDVLILEKGTALLVVNKSPFQLFDLTESEMFATNEKDFMKYASIKRIAHTDKSLLILD